MNIRQYMSNNIVYLDGGMGTLLQSRGLGAGELPERWNISHPDIITEIHTDYFNAGSNIVSTNTFGANILKYDMDELTLIVHSAIDNVRRAISLSTSTQPKWVALDIGPIGRMLQPYGDMSLEEAIEIFATTVRIGVEYGVDLVYIETMNDSYETKAAVLAVKENCDLPVFVSNAYSDDDKLMTGASPEAMVAMLEGLGVDAIGVNCSYGPTKSASVIEQYLKHASIPVIMKPNAGLPEVVDGKTVFDLSPKQFAQEVARCVDAGVRICGGCCGTTPEYIGQLVKCSEGIKPKVISKKNRTVVSSYTHAVAIENAPILIGERINPTGKPRFKEALRNGDIDYILREGISQQEKGVHILDVNVGLPEIDEEAVLEKVVSELQGVVDLPLQIDTSSVDAMARALRIYNGKPMLNSVNGKQESMDSIFPLAKKYGAVIIALTLDESGIPATAEGRVDIARKILDNASRWGIAKEDIVFDPLAMTVSADASAGVQTLRAVRMLRDIGCHVSLGVSNVSFGLPNRDLINSTYFTMALQEGLSMAILNPHSIDMMRAYYAYLALVGLDDNFSNYVDFASSIATTTTVATKVENTLKEEGDSPLQYAILKGLKEQAGTLTESMLESVPPLEIVNSHIIPALDKVGQSFEKKITYLPQLLMSAEASQVAFEKIKSKMSGQNSINKCTFVLATVEGDIHDIGKNIVKLLLQNYGYDVIDLGKNVPPMTIVDTIVDTHAPLVGLSALMTTTVPSMQESIRLIRERAPWCKVVVGGAVLTQEYADKIGADKYAKDAMATVRYAEQIYEI